MTTQAPSKELAYRDALARIRQVCRSDAKDFEAATIERRQVYDIANTTLDAHGDLYASGHEPPAGPYRIEPHGDGHALYSGRDQMHHGFNLARINEATPETLALIERALNAGASARTCNHGAKQGSQLLTLVSTSQPPSPDAARYQWLRSHIAPSIISRIMGTVNDETRDSRPEALDALIDKRLGITKESAQ